MIKIVFIISIFFFILFPNSSNAKIEIKYKIGNEVITNIDIENESKYLIFLRSNLKNLPDNELKKISENSLIREIIKKKEINKIYKNINKDVVKKKVNEKLIRFTKVSNEEELRNLLKKNNINYDIIFEKTKYEQLWNDLIIRKYDALVKIDRKKLKKDLAIKISNNQKYEYDLSEILFDINENESLETKYEIIRKFIKNNNFKSAASKYSIANSSIRGGEVGWVKETLLSKELINFLKKMDIGEITKPLKYPNGYLLLKINNKKKMKEVINIDKELDELYSYERNKQLNQFSILYFKKLKQNTTINEK